MAEKKEFKDMWVAFAQAALSNYKIPDELEEGDIDELVDDMVDVATATADSMLDEFEDRFSGSRRGERRRKRRGQEDDPPESR